MSNEIKSGILIVAGILLFIVGYLFLKGTSLFSGDKTYYVVYDEVEGLATSDPVVYHGLSIGKITRMALLDETSGKTVVTIKLQKDMKFPANSDFLLSSRDLLGEKQLQLRKGDAQAFAQPGDTLQGTVAGSITEEIGSAITPLKTKFLNLNDEIEKLNNQMDSIMWAVRIVIEEHQKKKVENK